MSYSGQLNFKYSNGSEWRFTWEKIGLINGLTQIDWKVTSVNNKAPSNYESFTLLGGTQETHYVYDASGIHLSLEGTYLVDVASSMGFIFNVPNGTITSATGAYSYSSTTANFVVGEPQGMCRTKYGDYVDAVFEWKRTSYSILDRISVIEWKVTPKSYNQYHAVDFELKINGNAVSGTSGTFEIIHSGANPASFTANLKVIDIVGTIPNKSSIEGSFTFMVDGVPQQATLYSVPNFTDEENPTITYDNPSNYMVDFLQAGITDSSENTLIAFRDVPKKGRSYTFELTEAEREILRSKITTGNTTTVRFCLRTIIDGQTYHSHVTRTLTLTDSGITLNPSIPIDVSETTVALTGDNTKLIKYHSDVQLSINAEAHKGATIVTYRVANSDMVIWDTQDVYIENVTSGNFYYYAKDDRGNVAETTITAEMIDYFEPTIEVSYLNLNLTGDLTFVLNGRYFNGSFGARENSFHIEYAYAEVGDTPLTYYSLPRSSSTITGHNFTSEHTIQGLDPDKSYRVVVRFRDALEEAYSSNTSVSARPIFDWGRADFKHNTPVTFDSNTVIRAIDDSGNYREVLDPYNTSGGVSLGYGAWINEEGDTNIYGDTVNLIATNGVTVNGVPIGGGGTQNVLWKGQHPLHASSIVEYGKSIQDMPNGIILVFSLLQQGTPADASLHSFFISKKEVELFPGKPHTFFLLINSGFSKMGAKYVYIYDNYLVGHDTNTTTSSNNNMAFDNMSFVLRYVIEV